MQVYQNLLNIELVDLMCKCLLAKMMMLSLLLVIVGFEFYLYLGNMHMVHFALPVHACI